MIVKETSFERKGALCIWTLASNRYVPMRMLRSVEALIIFEFRLAEVGSSFETRL